MRKFYLSKKLFLLLIFSAFTTPCFTQVTEEWVRRYNGVESTIRFDYTADIVTDAFGNVYVTGGSMNLSSNLDYVTIKYDAAGNEIWIRRYDGHQGNDQAFDIAVDAQGNVYVTGQGLSPTTGNDYVTIKYDAAGNEIWVRRYSGPGNLPDHAFSLGLDGWGNVYVTGFSYSNERNYDYATVKYSATGDLLWVKTYNGPGNGLDEAHSIAVDALGNVTITGYSQGSGTNQDYATISYDGAGNQLWVSRYNGPGNGHDWALDLALDASNNIYITGRSQGNGTDLDYATLKYDPSGNQMWVQRYNGPGDGEDAAYKLVVDVLGNVSVTGWSLGSGTDFDYTTIRYDGAGNQLWVQRYNGAGNGFDRAFSVTSDGQGNVYVTGTSNRGLGQDIATVKYNASGVEQWVQFYDSPDGLYDGGNDITVDVLGNFYITGESETFETSTDYLTIKYAQTVVPPPPVKISAGSDQRVYLGYGSNCVTLTALATEGTPPYTYSWSNGAGSSATVNVCPTTTTTYTVTVTDSRSQTASDEVIVTVVDARCGRKEEKVVVCHNGKPLCLAKAAVDAHLKHGDQLGSCTTPPSVTHKPNAEKMLPVEALDKTFHTSVAPNPFSTATRLQYTVPADGKVTVKLMDATGRELQTLASGERKAGVYSADISAAGLANGLYYYQVAFVTGSQVQTRTGKLLVRK